MKRIAALALALFMVMMLFMCSGFTLRDTGKTAEPTPEPTREPGTEDEEENEPKWRTQEFVSEDDFGDESHHALLIYMIEGTIPEDDSNAMVTVLISLGKVLGITGDMADATLFTLNTIGTSLSNLGEYIFEEPDITLKIKIDDEQYETELILVASGIYSTFADSSELYGKMIESLEKEEDVKCVLVSDNTKLQFTLEGLGYSDAVELMNEYNEADTTEKEERFNVEEGKITRK